MIDIGKDLQKAYEEGYKQGRYDEKIETELKRKTGQWIQDESGDYKCSECGGREDQFIYGTENWYGDGESNFCPNCGARMDGESE